MRFKLLFDIEPVEQARPRARKLRQGIMMYDPAKVKNFKRRLHDMAIDGGAEREDLFLSGSAELYQQD